MQPIFNFLIQSVLISAGFLAVYHLFLKRETLFKENRLFLLSGLVLAFTFPLIKIQKTVVVSRSSLLQVSETGADTAPLTTESSLFTLENILIAIYIGVCLVLLTRFIIKLFALKKLASNAHRRREKPYLHLETKKKISPFSFFNYIFYNPHLFDANELHTVLEHEKVHARQLHTVDILLLELLKIVFWFNPFLWLYKSAVKQNLEYLADYYAIAGVESRKSYQYIMLKQAVEKQEYSLANSFYNSLIKKRIVMLNQNQSKKINVLKTMAVAPLLGLLLASFSIEETYLYKESDSVDAIMADETTKEDKTIELTIDKNTTDTELDNIKKDLAKDGIDFSYTTVRNDEREIIGISLQMSGKNSEGKTFSGNYNTDSPGPIGPITVLYDDENNAVSFWNAPKKNTVRIHTLDKDNISWTTSNKEEIVVKKVDGKKKVFINGKELDEDKMQSMDIHLDNEDGEGSVFVVQRNNDDTKHVKIEKIVSKKDGMNIVKIVDSDDENDKEVKIKKTSKVMIIKDSDDDEDIEVIGDDDDTSYVFIDNDGKTEPLYYIDGKKVKSKDLKDLSPSAIKNMVVLKGDKALEKYGKKAKNGVIEITLKKNK
ncbi:M56 family metallopeptidase [Flagellimonas okinawensis]|uniref:M56 family metallopeptidase n=1 Tax=Flagellimonas okinawensis TaxID=3031324 RepID=A0ABT5XKU6_9FLAO|nr:M56 family metallopeptidase [[Muricauda] okinawensis]MDF0706513.1 M56 family metallopeptidase [[Muricauda] okinawensis]